MISGVHTSVNMHVTTHYNTDDANQTSRNHSAYYQKLGPYPQRIKNLHFAYALSVRALNMIANQLIDNDYTTGLCEKDDQMTGLYMMDLLATSLINCHESFNETSLFQNTSPELISEI